MKIRLFIITVASIVLLVSCSSKPNIAKTTGANEKQTANIELAIKYSGIVEVKSFEAYDQELETAKFAVDDKIYLLTDAQGARYFMVLNKELRVIAVYDESETLVYI